jgi:hypothetical protein
MKPPHHLQAIDEGHKFRGRLQQNLSAAAAKKGKTWRNGSGVTSSFKNSTLNSTVLNNLIKDANVMKEPPQIRTGKVLFIKRDPSPGEDSNKQARGLDHLSDTCYVEKMNEILRNFSQKNKH